jgi:PAS domain S-box-containing protein
MKELKMTNNSHLGISEVWFHRSVTLFCMVFFLLTGAVSGAEGHARKVVRIPFREFNRLMELDENNNPVSGYAYEFIETIGIYAGWDIEFIPCDGFSDGMENLLAGKVDLFYDVSYTEERAKEILFPDEPMGFEYYYLYASKENTAITSVDIDSIRGKTVGVTAGTTLIDLLKQWSTKKKVDLNLVEYDSIPKKEADLLAGKIDLDLEVSMLAINELSAVEKIGSSAYYLVANKERPDLIEDINSAMEKVLNNDLYFFSRLQERYFSETVLSHNLTLEEKDWIANHKVLRVGFFDNYLPFSALDKNGNPTGACIEAVKEVINKLKLEDDLDVKFICYHDQRAGYNAVESGEVDLMLPAYISNSVKHDYRIMGGKILATLTSDLAFLDDFGDGKGKRIAVNRHNLMQYYNSRDSYPYSEVVFYDSIQGCLDGILDGTSDGTFLNGLRSEALLKPDKYHSLKKAQARTNYIFYMAFAEENLGLMLLMNRGMSMLDPAFVNKKAYNYLLQMNSFTMMDYFRDHILLLVLAVAVLVAVAVTLIGYRLSIRKLAEINRELRGRSETIEKQRQQEAELRKQLEDALHMAQDADREKTGVLKDLEDASELARLASFHYDFNTRIRTGSNLINELWPEDENGNALLEEEFVYPEDLPSFKQNMHALFEKKNETNGTVQFSFRVGFSANDLRYYRMKLTIDPRNPNALTGIVQDVTELALSMLKLKDTQALWNTAINSIPIMFTVKDMDDDFRYLLCNKAFANVFNFSPDEIVGKTDHDIFHDNTTLGFADQLNSPSTGTDGLMEIEGELPDGNGNLRYIKSILRVFEDARGHRLLLAAANDVTDMHMLFQNQRVVNKLLADIIGEDDFDLCIQRTLETVGKILGASRGTLMKHDEDTPMVQCVSEYVDPNHPFAHFKSHNLRFSRTGGFMGNSDDTGTFICNDVASLDWTKVSEGMHQAAIRFDLRAIFLSNIVFNGKIWGTVGFNFEGVDHTFTENEITLLRATAHMIEVVLARKHAQALIMDALAHAQAADKAKSFFIASVSHEIRTPLNSVIGFAELLREGGVSKNKEKEYLDAISSSANALLMLINDVLDLSKLEANQMQIITAFTDFNVLCHEVMLIFTFRAQENANKLISNVPDDLPELDIDNIRIRQILINLLGNAVKFTKNGSITLQVTFTPDPDSADTGTLRFAVSDTGIGISEEDQKKLMEPFVQLSRMRGTNAVNNGTGLGLSISKRLATRMNGELTCTSKIGEGSTFEVTLNSVRYRAKAVQPDKAAQSEDEVEAIVRDVKTIRILIVDDVPMNLRVAKALFNKIGFNNVFTAGSGKEALAFLDKQPVDLILSDMWMPEMNGSQLSAEVKSNPRFAHIPIVAQTADVETSGNFDMSHFDAIILKPVTKEKLSHMVKRIIKDGDLQKGDGGMPVNLG